jgi:hypothetical protein
MLILNVGYFYIVYRFDMSYFFAIHYMCLITM